MSNKKQKPNKKKHELEIIRVAEPLAPWQGRARDYKPNLSDDFKKRQKLKARDKILLIVQKQADKDKSDTIEYRLEIAAPENEKQDNESLIEMQKVITKQRAHKKSLQEILGKERKNNKALEKKLEKKKQQWSLEKESLQKENHKFKDNIVALESQLQILNQHTQMVINNYKSKLLLKQSQYREEKGSNLQIAQELQIEKKRRQSLHSILGENAKENREGLEKLVEVCQERDELLQKSENLHKEKVLLMEDRQLLQQNFDALTKQLNLYEESFASQNEIAEKLQKAQQEVERLVTQNEHLQDQVEVYRKTITGKFVVDEIISGSRGIYTIVQKYKRGGMGDLYLAKRHVDEEIVAIKTLQFSDEGDENKRILRFVQEARMMLYFQHPNLVKGLDFYQTPDKVFLVMEYIKGDSLEDVIGEQQVEEKKAADIVLQVARALNYLSTLGIVHRDVKPANIIIDENQVAKLMDFGIFKSIHGKCTLTTSGIIMGTPYYLSPEQVTDNYIDIKSDVYSLGITFYQLVTGKVPFQGENQVEVIAKRLTKTSPRVKKENPNVSKVLCNLIEKMMDYKPARRPAPIDIVEELESFLEIQNS
ncbi:protein kinase [Candidatus Uabimicrobium sp. HlEnr_7]|uniref:serine/threonine-protein kinase n=1 Tax=Candidatus Uabimicrobium helgolandensis TaxID=3095367 RepID=UPI003557DADC